MSDRHKQFAEELLSVRPATRDLVTSILMDAWPADTAIVDFGIDSQEHYESLYYPIREAQIMPKDLDAALGNGAKLTAMLRDAPSNPHKDVVFSTSWDIVFGRGSAGAAFDNVLSGNTEPPDVNNEHRLDEEQRLDGFRAVLNDYRNSSHFYVEIDGDLRKWGQLSPQAKLEYIAGDAAMYDVPFKYFDEGVRDLIGESGLAEAALQKVLKDALEFRSLSGLLPPDERLEGTPLIDRFKEILEQSTNRGREPDVETQTPLDVIFGRDSGGSTAVDAKEAFNEMLHGKTQGIQSAEGQLLGEIKTLAGQEYVYEDGWGGMVPFSGSLSEMQTGPPVPFGELTWREQADVLRSFVHWDNYPARDWHDEYVIRDNIAAGKSSEQWLDGTSLRESFQLLAEGKTPLPQKEWPEITEQDLRAALAEAGHALGPPAADGQMPEQGSAGARAFQDIFRNDQPRAAETKTKELGGWEV